MPDPDIDISQEIFPAIEAEGRRIASEIGADYVGCQLNERGELEYYLFNIKGTDKTFAGKNLEDARQRLAAAEKSFSEANLPLVLERFPYPSPEQMEIGGDIGKLKIDIPPPRGAPMRPKRPKPKAEAPRILTMSQYEQDWKPLGWKLLVIGPTSTWRQDWGDWEAIRDIVQNSLDEAESYSWSRDKDGLVISDNGKGMGIADFLLGPPKLKSDYARGRFGEGMKIAALAMIRQGYAIRIETVGKDVWIIFLEQEVNGRVRVLAALWKDGGTVRGSKFHIIGYTGPAYQERFAVNLPKSAILAQGPSIITMPKQRYNQLIELPSEPSVIFARDIYMRDIASPFSYNLWGFALAPDRHAPADDREMGLDIGRLWTTVADVNLLEIFFRMMRLPPDIPSYENQRIIMSTWEMGRVPTSDKSYLDIAIANKAAWQSAWVRVFGNNAVLRTQEQLMNTVNHLGYISILMSLSVRDFLGNLIQTDTELRDKSQEKLQEAEVVSDDKLERRELAHLKLARGIAGSVWSPIPIGGVYAAVIPPASDLVRTAGLYGTTTHVIYISLTQLYRGRDTVDTLLHELAHHKEFAQTGQSEDLSQAHAAAMTLVAAEVIEKLATGYYNDLLQAVVW